MLIRPAACVVYSLLVTVLASTSVLSRGLSKSLPPQPLADALEAFSQETGIQVLYGADIDSGVQSRGVPSGRLAEQALRELLRETGLTFEFVNQRTVTVMRVSDGGVDGKEPPPRTPIDSTGDTLPESTSGEADLPEPETTVGEVVVTGSHIRGSGTPAGSLVIALDRSYIENSSYAAVSDLLKTLPQTFGGGVGEVQSVATSDPSASNFNAGTAINLRGLGADSTLVLVNGRRQPAGGANGAFIDVSNIAVSAIERVEVLTDGASAIYGSDAVGGVVNVLLRKDFEGAETRASVGTYSGDASEIQVSQLFGKNWSEGNALMGYQYLNRESVARTDREYTASDDLRRFGGSDFRSVSSNPGNILCPFGQSTCTFGRPAFAIPSGQDGSSLASSDLLAGQINYHNLSEGGGTLLPEQEMHSAFFNVTQRLGERVELFTEGRFNTRDTIVNNSGRVATLTVPSTNPFFVDPFGGQTSIRISYNFLDDLGPQIGTGNVETYVGLLGASASIGTDWQIELTSSYGKESTHFVLSNQVNDQTSTGLLAALADPNPQTAFNPFGDGSHTNPATLNAIRATQIEDIRSRVLSTNATIDGPVFHLPGGPAKLALGADYRDENVSGVELFPGASSSKDLGRNVYAIFTELAIPIIGDANSRTGVRTLDLSIAARYEDYSDFGQTINPKIGASWSPAERINVRGTWGTSFKAPRLIQLFTGFPNAFDFPTFLQSPQGLISALVRSGNNPELQEETARVWTGGIDFGNGAAGFKHSLTYFSINYDDRVAAGGPTGNPFNVLFQESEWASIVTRNPSRAQIDDVCNAGLLLLQSVSACLASSPAVIADLRLRNLAEVRVRGLDLDSSHRWGTTAGDLTLGVTGTYTLSFERAVTKGSEATDIVDTVGNVPALRVRGSALWDYRDIGVSIFVNHTGSYKDNISIPNRSIGSWTTLDANIRYELPTFNQALEHTRLSVSAINLFDKNPPFANVGNPSLGAFGFDTANANLYGRILSVHLVKNW